MAPPSSALPPHPPRGLSSQGGHNIGMTSNTLFLFWGSSRYWQFDLWFLCLFKTSFNIWKFMVHVLLKPILENLGHYFTSVWYLLYCSSLESNLQYLRGLLCFSGTFLRMNGDLTSNLKKNCTPSPNICFETTRPSVSWHHITNYPIPQGTGIWPEHAFGDFKNELHCFLKQSHPPASSQK